MAPARGGPVPGGRYSIQLSKSRNASASRWRRSIHAGRQGCRQSQRFFEEPRGACPLELPSRLKFSASGKRHRERHVGCSRCATMSMGHLEFRIATEEYGKIWPKLGSLHGTWVSFPRAAETYRGSWSFPALLGRFPRRAEISGAPWKSPVVWGELRRVAEGSSILIAVTAPLENLRRRWNLQILLLKIPAPWVALRHRGEDGSGAWSLAAPRGRPARPAGPSPRRRRSPGTRRGLRRGAGGSRSLRKVASRRGALRVPWEGKTGRWKSPHPAVPGRRARPVSLRRRKVPRGAGNGGEPRLRVL